MRQIVPPPLVDFKARVLLSPTKAPRMSVEARHGRCAAAAPEPCFEVAGLMASTHSLNLGNILSPVQVRHSPSPNPNSAVRRLSGLLCDRTRSAHNPGHSGPWRMLCVARPIGRLSLLGKVEVHGGSEHAHLLLIVTVLAPTSTPGMQCRACFRERFPTDRAGEQPMRGRRCIVPCASVLKLAECRNARRPDFEKIFEQLERDYAGRKVKGNTEYTLCNRIDAATSCRVKSVVVLT